MMCDLRLEQEPLKDVNECCVMPVVSAFVASVCGNVSNPKGSLIGQLHPLSLHGFQPDCIM